MQALPRSLSGWRSLLLRALAVPPTAVIPPRHFGIRRVDSDQPIPRWSPVGDKTAHRQSAVLVLLTPLEREADGATSGRVVEDLVCTLTMRQGALRAHSGQMSFPGGRCDRVEGGAWEAPADAAARETLEEVGIPRDSYDILGTLEPVWSKPSNSWVTPVVALGLPSPAAPRHQQSGGSAVLPPAARAVIASPDEVASIHYASLTGLLDHSSHTHHRLLMDVPTASIAPPPAASASVTSSTTVEAEGSKRPRSPSSPSEAAPTNAKPQQGSTATYVMPVFFAQDADPFALTSSSEATTDAALVEQSTMPDWSIVVSTASVPTCTLPRDADHHAEALTMLRPGDMAGRSLVWGLTALVLANLITQITAARLGTTTTSVLTAAALDKPNENNTNNVERDDLFTVSNASHRFQLGPLLPCSRIGFADDALSGTSGAPKRKATPSQDDK